MGWDYELPKSEKQTHKHFWRLLRGIDEKRTADLPLHLWNLGYHHSKWDNWPPRDWSSIPGNLQRLEDNDERFTYTMDFIGPFKTHYKNAVGVKNTIDPYNADSDYVMYKDEFSGDLRSELDISYERCINKAISNLNNFQTDSLVRDKFIKLKKEDGDDDFDDGYDTTDSEEVPLPNSKNSLYENLNMEKIQYRRSSPEDIEMPTEYKDEVLGQLDKIIDHLVDSRLQRGYYNTQDNRPFDWRNVMHSIISVTKDEKYLPDHHLQAKENVFKLFNAKLARDPMPDPDPYFDPVDAIKQIEDANITLWKENNERLDEHEALEKLLKYQLKMERDMFQQEIPREEKTVPILNFSKQVLEHFETQAVKLNARKIWLDKFNKLEDAAKSYFDELKDDPIVTIGRTIKHEKYWILKHYTDKTFEPLEDEPRKHINPMVYNLKYYQANKHTIESVTPEPQEPLMKKRKIIKKSVKLKLKRFT